MRKKLLLGALFAMAALAGGYKAYSTWMGTTRVAFLNYQATELGRISKANDNGMIRLSEIDADDFGRLERYDMIIVNGMGLRINEAQRKQLEEASYSVPVLTHSATNPANNIVSVEEFDANYLMQYIGNGNLKNYRNMLAYVRKFIDGKRFMAPEPEPAERQPDYLLTHFDPKNENGDDLGFLSVKDYEQFLVDNDLYRPEAPAIVLTGFMGAAGDLTRAFEQKGFVVYRINKLQSFLGGHHADSIKADAVVNMAHGRLGDGFVEFLKQRNIPLFSPLNVNRLTAEWENDKQGMSGGFMSQSIVTPEIDGAIRPYVVFAHRLNSEGLQEVYGIPERMETFVSNVQKYINLKSKRNHDKRVAIVYYKGPGQSSLTASGMEVVPSLHNFLTRLRSEGYDVANLPASARELEQMMQALSLNHGSEVARLQFGNVALLPQPMAGEGSDAFKIIHGTNQAPPQDYIDSYLWIRNDFEADALIHFGTHGSLEYTPRRQVALGSDDWSDRLIADLPHLYLYTIGNVGEAMIAKRRTYAQLVSHLTPPFKESELRQTYRKLTEAIGAYNKLPSDEQSLKVKALTVEMGIARDLGLDTLQLSTPYTAEEVARIENFAEELVSEKITGRLYTMDEPYDEADIKTSVYAMATDPIAYGQLAVDKLKGRAKPEVEKHKQTFNSRYLTRARNTVTQLLNADSVTDDFICNYVGITPEELEMARKIEAMQSAPDPIQMMMQMADQMGAAEDAEPRVADKRSVSELRREKVSHEKKIPQMSREAYEKMEQTGRFPEKMLTAIKQGQKWYQEELKRDSLAKASGHLANASDSLTHVADKNNGGDMAAGKRSATRYTREQIHLAQAITTAEQALRNVGKYADALRKSPSMEMASLMNALSGGYVAPTPGGDIIVNPNTLPTGRNLYSINVENTPSEEAWENAKELADNTIRMYQERHDGAYPRKVSYTLWSSEFVETKGATIAQVLYMLGVEPLRDAFGRVTDLRLIPSEQLGRPRIDVVVQTSGQLRDLAASRLFLINRAIEMAANAPDDQYENLVKAGVTESERLLVEKGMSPKEAREVSRYRVFGGVDGNYGTGIQQMVQSANGWSDESQIAEVYLNNMGAYYGDEQNWESVRTAAFEAALTRTDVVIQPRQSNTWGALSLDHVYEFMGGMNLAVRNVTGQDPDAYLADYRNHSNMRMQEVKEAIGVESRTTLFNPAYIKEKMKGGGSSAAGLAEIVSNTYGWNVMKPKAIDNEMWDEIYNVYVKDCFDLGIKEFFDKQNPTALMEIAATMQESARKGMWRATEQQLQDLASLHDEMQASVEAQKQSLGKPAEPQASPNNDDKGMVLKKETLRDEAARSATVVNGLVAGGLAMAIVVLLIVMVRRRRRNASEE